MVERDPGHENRESDEERLIWLLREKGPKDPEAQDLLLRWTEDQERRAEELDDPVEALRINCRRARLYFDAGYKQEALENFEDARTQAKNEKRNEIWWIITDEMVEKGLIEEEKE